MVAKSGYITVQTNVQDHKSGSRTSFLKSNSEQGDRHKDEPNISTTTSHEQLKREISKETRNRKIDFSYLDSGIKRFTYLT